MVHKNLLLASEYGWTCVSSWYNKIKRKNWTHKITTKEIEICQSIKGCWKNFFSLV